MARQWRNMTAAHPCPRGMLGAEKCKPFPRDLWLAVSERELSHLKDYGSSLLPVQGHLFSFPIMKKDSSSFLQSLTCLAT